PHALQVGTAPIPRLHQLPQLGGRRRLAICVEQPRHVGHHPTSLAVVVVFVVFGFALIGHPHDPPYRMSVPIMPVWCDTETPENRRNRSPTTNLHPHTSTRTLARPPSTRGGADTPRDVPAARRPTRTGNHGSIPPPTRV